MKAYFESMMVSGTRVSMLHVEPKKDHRVADALRETCRTEEYKQFARQRESELKHMYRRMFMKYILTSPLTYLILATQIGLIILGWHIANQRVFINELGEATLAFDWPLFIGVVIFVIVTACISYMLLLREFRRVHSW